LQEYLTLLGALDKGLANYSVDDFYSLSRSIFVKHEGQLDKFDQLYGHYFKGLEYISEKDLGNIPEEWLRKNLEKHLSEEEKALIEAMGGPEALRKRFEELMKQQEERHEGGNKWIGTGGTSPFGAYGYNPEGYRIGQDGSRNRSAIKVWDKRQFANLDDQQELDTRNIKMALRRLRVFTREGIAEELDLDETIRKTSKNAGILDLEMVPSKENRVKVLLLLDIGGSMDDHVYICSKLFSAAKHEFKHLEHYYFHNCIYDYVWKDNRRRWSDRTPTIELFNKYNRDYKVIIVGDAAMSPYELMYTGGAVEFENSLTGIDWLRKVKEHFEYVSWINPNPEQSWDYFQSTAMIREEMENRMFPATISGLKEGMRSLLNKKVVNAPIRK
jgi:uncharacterized protein with von Willebrand factor type A (vWA) domain